MRPRKRLINGMKKCIDCNKYKIIHEYSSYITNGKRYYSSQCKKCKTKYVKESRRLSK